MTKLLLRPGNALICAIAVVHITWGFVLINSPQYTTGVSLIWKMCGSHISAGILFVMAGVCAIFSLFRIFPVWFNILMFSPQQFLLFISAIGAISCMITGEFADGAQYPKMFIFQDQSWIVVLCLFHIVAVWTSHLVKEVVILT